MSALRFPIVAHHVLRALLAALVVAACSEEKPALIEFDIETVEAQPVLMITTQSAGDSAAIGAAMEQAFGSLLRYMNEQNVPAVGPPMAIYEHYSEREARFAVALPVAEEDLGRFRDHSMVRTGTTYAGRVFKVVHVGPYTDLAETYEKAKAQMAAEGLEATGEDWEVYLNNPRETPPEKLVTEIYFPIGDGPLR